VIVRVASQNRTLYMRAVGRAVALMWVVVALLLAVMPSQHHAATYRVHVHEVAEHHHH
jgi:hypothetical protein